MLNNRNQGTIYERISNALDKRTANFKTGKRDNEPDKSVLIHSHWDYSKSMEDESQVIFL